MISQDQDIHEGADLAEKARSVRGSAESTDIHTSRRRQCTTRIGNLAIGNIHTT